MQIRIYPTFRETKSLGWNCTVRFSIRTSDQAELESFAWYSFAPTKREALEKAIASGIKRIREKSIP